MIQAIVSIGIPGCGKTTYLRPLAEKLQYEYINADEIREELTGDARDHSMEMKVWEQLYEQASSGLENTGIIIDATFTKPKDRRSIVDHLRLSGADEIIGLWFDTNYDVCVDRNQKRQRNVPLEVLEQMQSRIKLNPPSIEEGFDQILKVTE